ncbi:hypothetical protein SNE40_012547 [Patella caerulea]|uniref:TM2 domain-containing protein n=1 Tax=Patella caerulea TaxID=87958 RepID=A0AAN8JSM8_PATCE
MINNFYFAEESSTPSGVTISTISLVSSTDINSNQSSKHNEIDPLEFCPTNAPCDSLGGDCITCLNLEKNHSCTYGTIVETECMPKKEINCTGNKSFVRNVICKYCYQLPEWDYKCNQSTSCMISTSREYHPPQARFISLCTTNSHILCLGRRRFYKNKDCNWTSGYKWSTAFILSITLGGFGVDRFYLGLWREGIGKLFSFGGLGVWTLVDVILVGVGYVGPADGSVYI